jgi:hypothetical protein
MKIRISLLFIVLAAGGLAAEPLAKFNNALYQGQDPWIIRTGDFYYGHFEKPQI